jgi:hypothetical protein
MHDTNDFARPGVKGDHVTANLGKMNRPDSSHIQPRVSLNEPSTDFFKVVI